MKVIHCDNCGFTLSPDATVAHGDDGKIFCAKCAPLFKFTTTALLAVQPPLLPEDQKTRVGAPAVMPVGSPGTFGPVEPTKFFFCETCGKRITDRQILDGLARDKKLKGIYCTNCAAGVMTMAFNPETDAKPTGARSSGLHASPFGAKSAGAKGSGLHPATTSAKSSGLHASPFGAKSSGLHASPFGAKSSGLHPSPFSTKTSGSTASTSSRSPGKGHKSSSNNPAQLIAATSAAVIAVSFLALVASSGSGPVHPARARAPAPAYGSATPTRGTPGQRDPASLTQQTDGFSENADNSRR